MRLQKKENPVSATEISWRLGNPYELEDSQRRERIGMQVQIETPHLKHTSFNMWGVDEIHVGFHSKRPVCTKKSVREE